TVPSLDALARRLPSGLKATQATGPVCPVRTISCFPSAVSHNVTALSSDALARRLPSGLKATPKIGADPRVSFTSPVAASQNRIFGPPVLNLTLTQPTTRVPSGLKATPAGKRTLLATLKFG